MQLCNADAFFDFEPNFSSFLFFAEKGIDF